MDGWMDGGREGGRDGWMDGRMCKATCTLVHVCVVKRASADAADTRADPQIGRQIRFWADVDTLRPWYTQQGRRSVRKCCG